MANFLISISPNTSGKYFEIKKQKILIKNEQKQSSQIVFIIDNQNQINDKFLNKNQKNLIKNEKNQFPRK